MATENLRLKTPAPRKQRFIAIASLSLLVTVGLAMLYLSWRRWPDILVDFGRELYVPWQLNEGRLLYKDIAHLYGPFSHYLNSFIFNIFGAHLITLAVFNITLIAILTFFIYRVFLETTNSLTAVVNSAIFLTVFAFSQYVGIGNYNFVCPYSHETTHGIFLSFFSIYAFLYYLKSGRFAWLWLIGLATGLIYLTKVEVFVSILPAILTGLALITLIDKIIFITLLKS